MQYDMWAFDKNSVQTSKKITGKYVFRMNNDKHRTFDCSFDFIFIVHVADMDCGWRIFIEPPEVTLQNRAT